MPPDTRPAPTYKSPADGSFERNEPGNDAFLKARRADGRHPAREALGEGLRPRPDSDLGLARPRREARGVARARARSLDSCPPAESPRSMAEFRTVRFNDSGQGLFSPADMERLMRAEFDRAQRYKYPLVCALIAVDRLGQLQDLYGYDSKDEILRAVVGVVKSATRESDYLGHLQADRLMAVFPHTAPETASLLARRILTGAKKLRFERDGRSLCVSLSMGLAHNRHTGELSFDTLVRVAEEGLAVAEAGGGDRFIETELYQLFERRRKRTGETLDTFEPLKERPPEPRAPVPSQVIVEVPVPSDPDRVLSESILAMLAAQGYSADALAELDEETIAQAIKHFHETRNRNFDGEADEARSQIEILERRLAKLTALHAETEEELKRIAAMKGLDLGVASIYRSVQGISDSSTHKEMKRMLMREIFEANFELKMRGKPDLDRPAERR
jgi:diguanylate cyclase (GGDEF)-like protein